MKAGMVTVQGAVTTEEHAMLVCGVSEHGLGVQIVAFDASRKEFDSMVAYLDREEARAFIERFQAVLAGWPSTEVA